MKVVTQYNYNNQYIRSNSFNSLSGLSNPPFGISFKPKLITDLFVKSSQESQQGILKIKNIHSGEFGTECKGSKPLPDFEESFNYNELKGLYKLGYSTNIDAYANCFLKSSADKPLSTSSVYDCSVLYLFNKDKNTHFLYHTYYDSDKKEFDFLIKTFMPEGVTNAFIVPGDAKWYLRHYETMTEMLKSLRAADKVVPINIYHVNSKLPEIVGYKGQVFEIQNIRTMQGFSDRGQASFNLCDLQLNNTINPIFSRLSSEEEIARMRQILNQPNYDVEVLKVFNRLLEQRQKEINQIESCNTIEELNALIKSYPPGKTVGLFNALSRQKAKITAGKT